MGEDKGSDLDVFEGLAKKRPSQAPQGPGTVRGGYGAPTPPDKSASSSKPLPPPSKQTRQSGSLPMPQPPKDRSSAPPPSGGLPPPRSPSSSRAGDSDAPAVSVKPASVGALVDSGPESAAPGVAAADLDWDDEEEATNVFDRSGADLFDNLGKGGQQQSADESGRRDVGKAAALLASSGRSAQPVARNRMPSNEPVGRIPAPAPVPRDMSDRAPAPEAQPAARDRAPSWAPSQAPPPAEAEKKKGGGMTTLVLVAVAVLALGAAGFFYLRGSADASVTIKANHDGESVADADIYVDGKKSDCEFAPCTLDLAPGERSIRVVSGPLVGSLSVDVEGGESYRFEVDLGGSADAEETEDEAEPAVLELATTMEDVAIEVSIDGDARGELPIEIDDLEPGEHEITFSGPEKYGKVTKTVDLKAGETLKLDEIALPLQEIDTKFVLETRGADVELVQYEGDEKKDEETLDFTGKTAEKTLDTEYKWKVVATLEGYEDFEEVLDFDGAEDELTVEIELDKQAEPDPEPDPEPKTAATPTPQPPKAEPEPEPEPEPATPAKFGTINANSIPPSKVIIDGRPRGSTPVTGVRVSAGSHTVVFIHKKFGSKSRSVSVGAGQTKTAVVKFKK